MNSDNFSSLYSESSIADFCRIGQAVDHALSLGDIANCPAYEKLRGQVAAVWDLVDRSPDLPPELVTGSPLIVHANGLIVKPRDTSGFQIVGCFSGATDFSVHSPEQLELLFGHRNGSP